MKSYFSHLSTVHPEEERRELLVRTVDCPACGRPAGRKCTRGYSAVFACTGRYDAAAAAGLVPPLVRAVAT